MGGVQRMKYPVNNIYPSIQGEGCLTGTPMVILRLHGCDVGCPFCDTKETWRLHPDDECFTIPGALGTNQHYTPQTGTEINYYITRLYPSFKWVLLTGGEPAQYDLRSLIAALHDGGYKVALETSGTEPIVGTPDWVCVSPKINMPGKKPVLTKTLTCADEIKHAVGRQRDIDQLCDLIGKTSLKDTVQICLQPISQTQRATQLCIQTVQEKGWRLSIQTHKYLALP